MCAARGEPQAVPRVPAHRPGFGSAELMAATGIKRPVLYALLARLGQAGGVVKEQLPIGTLGYSLAREGRPTSGRRITGRCDPTGSILERT